MDDVPEFIIHFEIKSYLDYEDKINLNRALQPIHRMSKKIPIKDIVNHEFCVITRDLMLMLEKQKELTFLLPITDRNESAKAIENIFKYCMKPRVLDFISSFPGFKKAILEKTNTYKTMTVPEYQKVDMCNIKSLVYYSKVLEIKIHKNNCTKYLKYFQVDNSIRNPRSYLLS